MSRFQSWIAGLLVSATICAIAQEPHPGPDEFVRLRWSRAAFMMPEEWYGSDKAKAIAENLLLAQKDIGGWAKNIPYHHDFSEGEKAAFVESKSEAGATFDNGSTIVEMMFLARVHSHTGDERFRVSFIKGLNYIFEAQYTNGGWPQFFPVRLGSAVAYSGHITYNDDAMVNIMRLLGGVYANEKEFGSLKLDDSLKAKAKKAFQRGVDCILKTQIIVDGQRTVWCAQHDEKTFEPAGARSYELPSFSGSESASIVLLLMEIREPSNEVIEAVDSAVEWFRQHKIEGKQYTVETDQDGKRNRVVIDDPSAPPIWARFYDLETETPFFCDRDGIKKNSLAEIGHERRNAYRWYVMEPALVLTKYEAWKKECGKR